jgi:outer membrane lipoprotein carrier protein
MPVLSYGRARFLVTGLSTLALVLAVALGVPGQARAQAGDAEALARALQQRYDRVRDFTADFEHAYQGGVLRRSVTERGRVLIKKPGMMRWTYSGPDQKVFVSDGHKLYSYLPADRQVYVGTVPQGDEAPTPTLFLAGKGNLLRDFAVSVANPPDGAPPDTVALRLDPKRRDRDYDWLVLVVDRTTMQWRMLVTGDRQGGQSTFTFTNLRENVGLADREFTFRIPRGVDVITDTAPRQ